MIGSKNVNTMCERVTEDWLYSFLIDGFDTVSYVTLNRVSITPVRHSIVVLLALYIYQ